MGNKEFSQGFAGNANGSRELKTWGQWSRGSFALLMPMEADSKLKERLEMRGQKGASAAAAKPLESATKRMLEASLTAML